ncbi:MAG: acetyl-CoA carboxylase carboxyltransferase subunit beta [Candidatus Omnitrophica bacterium]|nr:acetyl-CoA carboxylase carboxyltransferase subunit beta [Candidatus Omnitrophota bacterium]
MSLFGKTINTFVRVSNKRKAIPDGVWLKCPECDQPSYTKEVEANVNVCPKCGYHMTLNARKRVELLADEGTFEEFDANMLSLDPLEFKGVKTYKDKLASDQKITGLLDAAITGSCKIAGCSAALAVTDSQFIMGSMGSVVGEKIARAVEYATKKRLPMVIVSGSGGGARMYEGCISLMQMAKTCAALSRHAEARLLYISVLTNPTMGGIMASFAGVGDVIMAEPKALLGFAGPRVIEQTVRQKLPKGFQTSEFMLAHGMLDMIVVRKEMKSTIAKVIGYASGHDRKG